MELAASSVLVAVGGGRGSSPPARGAAHPCNSRCGRYRPGNRPARSPERLAAEPESPGRPCRPPQGYGRGSKRAGGGWAGVAGEGRRGSVAPLCLSTSS